MKKLSELKFNQQFRLPDWPETGLFTYLGPDGGYGKIKANDAKINHKLCKMYDSTNDFFHLATWITVTPICPECGHVQDHEACNVRIE